MRPRARVPTCASLGAFALLIAFAASLPISRAETILRPPKGPIILTVSGSISMYTDPAAGVAEFDREALERLGLVHLRTHTRWTEGVQDFEGVLLRDLLTAVGASGMVALMTALNDYTVEIPLTDTDAYDVLIALKRNGADMPIRDNGPLWIIYPIAQHPEIDSTATDGKMIWQLRAIDIR